jgi:mono/diheme cytochrome c family protein
MKKEEREQYQKDYSEAKKRGIPFFPDAVFKDAIVALLVFLAVVGLTGYVGASLEEIADPSDSSYTPRPEWYFLFLFQLLKYFPGDLEVVGVFVIPVIALGFLVALPWTDRSARRHWSGRPVVTTVTGLLLAGALFLTVQAYLEEAPPTATATGGDRTAAIYSQNCSGCHGAQLVVGPGVDLFQVIQGGVHEGMPAWNSDLSANEIDALVGFILSPNGYEVFLANCRFCHNTQDLAEVASPDLRTAIDDGPEFPPHSRLGLPDYSETLTSDQQAKLLNFLAAPSGQRLWTQECSSCHGVSVAFSGGREEVETVIREGGGHLEMPAFSAQLSDEAIETLALYVTAPPSAPEGAALFGRYCASCHATRVPLAPDLFTALEIITLGGAHEDMPVWDEIFTDEQIDALVDYVLAAAELPDLGEAELLYLQNCASCHGDLGEGGVNPSRPGDVIAPISTAEYLTTRDDATLDAIISHGQPNFGMSPFADTFGGPLSAEQVDLIVAYMRAWEANPPVELPPDTPTVPGVTRSVGEVYEQLCGQCHGSSGEGGLGTAFDQPWQTSKSDQDIFDDINLGHAATAMIAWGEILNSQQIESLVAYIRSLTGDAEATARITWVGTIRPIFDTYCLACHGSLGGWTGETYEAAMTTGINGPTIIPEDPENSRLIQSLVGTHPDGMVMPPSAQLSQLDIQRIIAWVEAGAPER